MSMDDGDLQMSYVEMLAAIPGIAGVFHALRLQLIEEGEAEADAMKMTLAYIHGIAGGKFAA